MAKKEIQISQLRPGMFVSKIDISWINSPFLSHSMFIKTQTHIDRLRKSGVRLVTIDTDKGKDISDIADAEKAKESLASAAKDTTANQSGVLTKTSMKEELVVAKKLQKESFKVANAATENIKHDKAISAKPISPIIAGTLESLARNDQAIISLLHLEESSEKLLAHLFNVFSLALALALRMNLTEQEKEALGLAAFVHDAAWSKLPQNLFGTKTDYSTTENLLIEKHVDIVASLLAKSDGFSPEVINIIREHHERGDGSGYPKGLRADQISLCGKIIAVADCYDELIHGLAGYPGMLPKNALSHLYQAAQKGLFDIEIVAQLVNVIGVFPLNSAIVLSSGEKAKVIENNCSDPLHPKIRVFYMACGSPLNKPKDIDLSDPKHAVDGLAIKNIIDPHSPSVDPFQLLM